LWNILADVQFAFTSDRRLRCQIRRIFRKKTRAIAKYPQYSGNRGEVEVHEVRKEIQKLRALLKLIRGRLSGKQYREQNATLRLAAHALSPLRDADVGLKSLQLFKRRHPGKVLGSICDKLKKTQLKRRAEAYLDEPRMRKKLYAEIEESRRGFKELPIRNIDWLDVCEGIGTSYERGAKAYHEAERLRSKEYLHEWRKQVKVLRHQLSLMEHVLPPKFLKPLSELKCLSDCLGDDHDLAILDEVAATEELPLAEWKSFSSAVAEERYNLQQSAFLTGRTLYAEIREGFVQRIWEEWKKRKQG
jgi:CHAD domain-containing protein